MYEKSISYPQKRGRVFPCCLPTSTQIPCGSLASLICHLRNASVSLVVSLCGVSPAAARGHPLYYGMPVIKRYTVPPGASDAGAQQLRGLAKLKRKEYQRGNNNGSRNLLDEDCLEFHAKRARVSVSQPGKGMWNAEFIIASILESQGHSDAVPEGWLQPRTKADKLSVQPLVVAPPEPPALEVQEAQGVTRGPRSRTLLCQTAQTCKAAHHPIVLSAESLHRSIRHVQNRFGLKTLTSKHLFQLSIRAANYSLRDNAPYTRMHVLQDVPDNAIAHSAPQKSSCFKNALQLA